MSYSNAIMDTLKHYPALKLIDAHKLYQESFKGGSELTFYKVLSRLTKNNEIVRLSKGFYFKPKQGIFGTVHSSEKDLLEYFLGKSGHHGVVVGYRLFHKYGLTTQFSKNAELYSNVINQKEKKILNLTIKKIDLRFNPKTKMMIELLEIIENYKTIEALNKKALIKFIEDRVHYYDIKTVERVLHACTYKKRTIASLKTILDYFNIDNTLEQYLNGTSRYNEIDWVEFYETA